LFCTLRTQPCTHTAHVSKSNTPTHTVTHARSQLTKWQHNAMLCRALLQSHTGTSVIFSLLQRRPRHVLTSHASNAGTVQGCLSHSQTACAAVTNRQVNTTRIKHSGSRANISLETPWLWTPRLLGESGHSGCLKPPITTRTLRLCSYTGNGLAIPRLQRPTCQ
jgi:hypothetical protein